MAQRAATPAKAMMSAVEQILAETNGTFPTPRALRAVVQGSQERAADAILAVQIARGVLPHLRHTLPEEFQRALPPVNDVPTLTQEALAGLPDEAQRAANACFLAMGTAYRAEVEAVRAELATAKTRFEEETAQCRAQFTTAMKEQDDADREAEAALKTLQDELTALRIEATTLRATIVSKDTELAVRATAHEDMQRQAREAARAADERQGQQIARLAEALDAERERCRVAEQSVARLTAALEALNAKPARRDLGGASEGARDSGGVTTTKPTTPRARARKVEVTAAV